MRGLRDVKNLINTVAFGESKKIYKIKYTLNILPSMSEEEETLMNTAGQTDELEIFDCKALIDYIEFKWTNYAGPIHKVGATFHAMYIFVFSWFVFEFYLYKTSEYRIFLFVMMGFSLIYPTVYDFTQLRKQGFKEYFSDVWNYFDQSHIWIGYMSILMQALYQDTFVKDPATGGLKYEDGVKVIVRDAHIPRHKKTLLIVVTFILLMKTFFFLRIFKSLAHLVLMMRQVCNDLKAFMIFYTVLLWICGLVFTIIGLGNYDGTSDKNLITLIKKNSYPGVEY